MTDVTGFGLAGHIQAICAASGLRAEVMQSAVPMYQGARALSQGGTGSSLLSANIANAPTTGITDPLLHDPQTAGGLLAALPQSAADQAIRALKKEGLEGWIIGTLHAGQGPITVT